MPGADKTDSGYAYGYGAAQTLAKVLEMCGDDLTRANVIKQAASLRDLPLTLLCPASKSTPGLPTSRRLARFS
jgi:branched-chain amino acid transport system substrate-binding protein